MNSKRQIAEGRALRACRSEHWAHSVAGITLLALLSLLPVLASTATASDSPAGQTGVEPEALFSPADEIGRFVYIIELAEPGAMQRDLRGPGERFDRSSPRVEEILSEIQHEQSDHLQAMTQVLGVTPEVTHYFLVSHSGMAARLHPLEAEMVRGLPGVVSVERERLYEMNTFRGPSFIGADEIWDGTAVPNNVGTKGEGSVIGMLDSGVFSAHPSFANDVACGHGVGSNPDKLLSSLDCATTDAGGLCNGPSPEDTNGHGTHTASTSGGNTLDGTAVPPPVPPAPYTEISGVAPCANIRSYKVCPAGTCPGAAIQAGMDSILLHGDVSVMNFSISGGRNPWVDNDRRKLDLVDAGVFVAASAGNTGTGIPDPVGQVNHNGPWVFTVAASTHDAGGGSISASGPGTPPAETQDISAVRGSDSPVSAAQSDHPVKHYTGQPDTEEGCDSAPAFPANFFDGAAALIHRGSCSFTEKITNAFNAGADFVVIRNNVAGALSMSTPLQPAIPAYSINQEPGNALVAFVDANPDTATFDFEPQGDVLAGFSLRGPTPAPLEDLNKPDITGPGVNIYAAQPGPGYGNLSGTSMSSPHAAGAATLVRAVHPSWTVSEVKSALMMTAFTGGTKEDGATPWDADDVGTGALDLTKAALAGLVMDETFANYLAANPATGGDVKTLNLPAVRSMNCTPNCTWTRTVRNTLDAATSWTASGNSIAGDLSITIDPSAFAFTGDLGETQELTITATPLGVLTGAVSFGEVVLTEGGSLSPDQRITVAIMGDGSIFIDGFESGDTSQWSRTVN